MNECPRKVRVSIARREEKEDCVKGLEKKSNITTEQAIEFILAPCSDSELSELQESDVEGPEESSSTSERIKRVNNDYGSDEEALIECVKKSKRIEVETSKEEDQVTESDSNIDNGFEDDNNDGGDAKVLVIIMMIKSPKKELALAKEIKNTKFLGQGFSTTLKCFGKLSLIN